MRTLHEIEQDLLAVGRPELELGKAVRMGPDGLERERQRLAAWDAEHPEQAARYAELSREMVAAERERDHRQHQAELARWAQKRLTDAGVGDRAAEASRNPRESEALEATKEWLDGNKCWLVLLGGTGTGKTVASAWAINATLEAEAKRPLFFAGEARGAAFRLASQVARLSGFDEGARELDQLASVAMLVVDDIGAESQTAWGAGLLAEVLDRRHQGFRKTILTSNLGQEQFKQRVGERMVDRIREDGRVVILGGKSMRRA